MIRILDIGTRSVCGLAAAVLLAAVSCSRSPEASAPTTNTNAEPPGVKAAMPFDPKSPILVAVMASSIDPKGEPVDPRFTFTQDEPQIAIMVQVGKITGSPLDIAWHQSGSDGDQKLFEHHVQVNSFDRAYSIGKNPGTLAAASYNVTVTLEGHSREVAFDIVPKPPPQRPSAPPTSSSDSQSATTVAAADGKPPVSGQSGTVPRPPAAPGAPRDSYPWGQKQRAEAKPCFLEVGTLVEPDPDSPYVGVFAAENCGGAPADVDVTAAIDKTPTATFAETAFSYFIDPCVLSSPSDQPGTKVTFTAVGKEGTPRPSMTVVATLGPDTLRPRVSLITEPPDHTKVKPGDTIKIRATATEYSNIGTWQSGLMNFQILDNAGTNSRGVLKSWRNPSPTAVPCKAKTTELPLQVDYKVPSKPGTTIRICALAEDYAANPTLVCHEFPTAEVSNPTGNASSPTAEVWSGTWQYESSRVYTGGALQCHDAWNGTLSLMVVPDGSLKGKASATLGRAVCTEATGIPPVPSRNFSLSGRQTAGGDFELHFQSAGPPDPDRTGDFVSGNLLLAGSSSQCFHSPTPTVILRKQANGMATGTLELKETPFLPQCPNAADVLTIKARFEVRPGS